MKRITKTIVYLVLFVVSTMTSKVYSQELPPIYNDPEYDGVLLEVADTNNISQYSFENWDDPERVGDTSYVVVKPDVQSTQEDINEIINEFLSKPNVVHAQPNYKYRLSAIPNDSYLGEQWGLHNTGQTIAGAGVTSTGRYNFDMDGPYVWGEEDAGNTDVVVAVIDTGIDPLHPDLVGNIITGYDFMDNDTSPYDFHGHGTHVAGIIGATSNNAAGISGVSYLNKVKIMPLKIDLTTAQIMLAISYAEANSVKVINASWGGDVFDSDLYDAIEGFSGIFVAAAGNDGRNIDTYPTYPAAYDLDNVITVEAYQNDGQRAYYSNYGPTTVDVGAPGSQILSTYPAFSPLVDETFTSLAIGTDISGSVFSETSGDWGIVGGAKSLSTNNRTYENNSDMIATLTTPVDTSGVTEFPRLRFTLDAEIEPDPNCNKDYLAIETDNNDENWVERVKICGSWNDPFIVDLMSTENSHRFRFRWVTNGSVTGYAPLIDNIELISYNNISHGYAYMNGTSMAAPYVAGEVALIMSNRSDLTNNEIKSLVVKSQVSNIINTFDTVVNSYTVYDNWYSTAGVASTNLVSAVWGNTLYESVFGTNNRLYTRSATTIPSWTQWEIVSSLSYHTPTMEVHNECLYECFTGGNKRMYIRKTCDGTNWTYWQDFGGKTVDASVLKSFDGRLYHVMRGLDSRIYTRYTVDGNTWSTWRYDGGKTYQPPSMEVYNGELYQIHTGLDYKSAYMRSMDTSHIWGGISSIGGTVKGAISMEEYNGRLYISYPTTKTSIVQRSYSIDDRWTNELFISGSTTEIPTLTSFKGVLYQNALGGGGTLHERATK